MDLRLPSYQNPSNIKSQIWSNAEKLSRYKGGGSGTLRVDESQIKQRILAVGIPKGVATPIQWNAIRQVQQDITKTFPNVKVKIKQVK
ncbi:MAG TPA: hypothetical protein VJ180_07145 [Pyrinomonadaceae bacterium]|nr:hypothetical protein [Pyrinomonadaceae bacterium]